MTPGDHEEECIGMLNELTYDDVEVSSKIIGQGNVIGKTLLGRGLCHIRSLGGG